MSVVISLCDLSGAFTQPLAHLPLDWWRVRHAGAAARRVAGRTGRPHPQGASWSRACELPQRHSGRFRASCLRGEPDANRGRRVITSADLLADLRATTQADAARALAEAIARTP